MPLFGLVFSYIYVFITSMGICISLYAAFLSFFFTYICAHYIYICVYMPCFVLVFSPIYVLITYMCVYARFCLCSHIYTLFSIYMCVYTAFCFVFYTCSLCIPAAFGFGFLTYTLCYIYYTMHITRYRTFMWRNGWKCNVWKRKSSKLWRRNTALRLNVCRVICVGTVLWPNSKENVKWTTALPSKRPILTNTPRYIYIYMVYMHLYEYIYLYVCVCMYVLCVYVYWGRRPILTNTRRYTYIYMYVCVFVCMYIGQEGRFWPILSGVCIYAVYIYTWYICMCVYVYVCIYVCECIHMSVKKADFTNTPRYICGVHIYMFICLCIYTLYTYACVVYMCMYMYVYTYILLFIILYVYI